MTRKMVRRFLSLSILLLGLLLPVAALADEGLGSYYVTAETLNARSGPSRFSPVVTTYQRHDEVTVTERRGAWAKVTGKDLDPLWVHGSYLGRTRAESSSPRPLALDPKDPRITGLPKVSESAISQEDLLILRTGATLLLASGRCADVIYGNKLARDSDPYVIDCNKDGIIYFNAVDVAEASVSVPDREHDGGLSLRVARAQALLKELGYEPGFPDGIARFRTRTAIARFRRDHGLGASPEVDDVLLAQLEEASYRQDKLPGIGITRHAFQSVFSAPELGFTFREGRPSRDEPHLIGISNITDAYLRLVDPADNLTAVILAYTIGAVDPEEISINSRYLAKLFELGLPGWEGAGDWVERAVPRAVEGRMMVKVHRSRKLTLRYFEETTSFYFVVSGLGPE